MGVDVSGMLVLATELADKAARLPVEVQALAREAGQRSESYARQIVPVRTGYLRSTIYHQVHGMTLELGARADYAAYVEFGTSTQRPQPYISTAIERVVPDYAARISTKLEEGW